MTALHVRARQVEVPGPSASFAYQGSTALCRVDRFPVVWLRTDPPFDLPYVEATWILDRVDRQRSLRVNDPTGVRGANEKLYALRFPQLCPPTLVSADREQLRAFVSTYREVVLKPVGGCGGEGILFAQEGMRGLNAVIEAATAGGQRTVAQAYLPAAAEGDTRVLLLDGEPLGSVRRVHGAGEERNNLHLGGKAVRTELDPGTAEVIRAIAPSLRTDGLHFVGIDVIGGKLTEVNVTSPTGIQEMERLEGVDLCRKVITWCEERAPG